MHIAKIFLTAGRRMTGFKLFVFFSPSCFSLEVFVKVQECLLSRFLDIHLFQHFLFNISAIIWCVVLGAYLIYSEYMLFIPGLLPFLSFLDAILISSSVKNFFMLQGGYSLTVPWLSFSKIYLKKLMISLVCCFSVLTTLPFPL